jgi:hypothetical protein
MARRTTPTQADMTRALKAAIAAGVSVGRVEIDGGKIIIVAAPTIVQQPADELDAELAQFEKTHGED